MSRARVYRRVTMADVEELIAEFPELAYYRDLGRNADAFRLGRALRGFVEPELTMRRNNIVLSIAAELREKRAQVRNRLSLVRGGGR